MVTSLILMALIPIFVIAGEKISYKVQTAYLKHWKYATHHNNQTDNIKFIELYAGPEFIFPRR
jgi:hypothetical protein